MSGRPENGPEAAEKFLLSQLKPILRSRGFRPRRSLGQNFLFDPNTLRFIAAAARSGPRDIIFEVGTGPGLLTQYLAEVAGEVYSVEIDDALFEVASKMLAPHSNVHLIRGDVLAGKGRVDPAILDRIPDPPDPGGSIICVSNLPYSTATPIVVGLLEGEPRIRRLIVTVQREIGDRLLAPPGERTFGASTVLVRLHARTEALKSLPSKVFWPVPEVRSVVLKLDRRVPPLGLADYDEFKRFLRGLFTQRRKTLLRALSQNPAHPVSDHVARAGLAAVQLPPSRRVEAVEAEGILELFRALSTPRERDLSDS